MSLKEMMTALKTARTTASTEVHGDPRTRPGREMMRRAAQDEVPVLEKKLATELKKVGFIVFVDGDNADAFIRAASEETECARVDWDAAFSGIYSAVIQALSNNNREFSPSAFSAMVREAKVLAVDTGLTSIPSPTYDGPTYFKDVDSIKATVNGYLVNQFGSEFVAAVIERQALNEIQKKGLECANPVIPVMVRGAPADTRKKVTQYVFQGKSVTAEPAEDFDQSYVLKVFKEIKKELKESKK